MKKEYVRANNGFGLRYIPNAILYIGSEAKKAHCLTTLNDIKAAQADGYHLLLILYILSVSRLQLSLQSAHLHLMEHEILHNQPVANYHRDV